MFIEIQRSLCAVIDMKISYVVTLCWCPRRKTLILSPNFVLLDSLEHHWKKPLHEEEEDEDEEGGSKLNQNEKWRLWFNGFGGGVRVISTFQYFLFFYKSEVESLEHVAFGLFYKYRGKLHNLPRDYDVYKQHKTRGQINFI